MPESRTQVRRRESRRHVSGSLPANRSPSSQPAWSRPAIRLENSSGSTGPRLSSPNQPNRLQTLPSNSARRTTTPFLRSPSHCGGTACIGSRCSCRFSWEPSRLGVWRLSASAIMHSVEEGQNCSTGTEDERILVMVRNRLPETDAMKQFDEAGIRAKGIELDGVTSVERKCVSPEGLIQ
jgi:hypothetical protein